MACAGGLCLCLSCAAAISRTGWNIPGMSAVAISPRLCSQPATNIQSILPDRHPEGLVTGLESALPTLTSSVHGLHKPEAADNPSIGVTNRQIPLSLTNSSSEVHGLK